MSRIDSIGQNGNEGDHYLDIPCPEPYREEVHIHLREKEAVNEPDHYNILGDHQVIDIIEEILGEKFDAFCHGNVLKYILRANKKGGLEDFKKARKYLNYMLKETD